MCVEIEVPRFFPEKSQHPSLNNIESQECKEPMLLETRISDDNFDWDNHLSAYLQLS